MENPDGLISIFKIGTLFMFIVAFLLISLVLFYQSYLGKIKKKERDEIVKASLESEKRERGRIAADLHDGLTGDLYSIRNYLIVLKNKNQHLESNELLDSINIEIGRVLENLRIITHNLMPSQLESEGLLAALDVYFGVLSKRTTINFQFKSREAIDLGITTNYELFRIIQEFVTNIIKHGESMNVTLDLKNTALEVILEITDDGNTFDFKEQVEISMGSGVRNIMNRVKFLDAELSQEATPDGNHFLITLKKNNG